MKLPSIAEALARRISTAAQARAEADALQEQADTASPFDPADEAAYQDGMRRLRSSLRRRPCSLCVRGTGCDGPC